MASSTFTSLCNRHLYLVPKHFSTPKGNPIPTKQSLPICPSLHPIETTNLLYVSIDLLFWICYTNGTVNMWYLMSGFFHLEYFPDSCNRIMPFYGWILLYVHTKMCFSIHPLMDTWVVFTFWIVPLWTFRYKLLLEYLFSVLWGICLAVELWII